MVHIKSTSSDLLLLWPFLDCFHSLDLLFRIAQLQLVYSIMINQAELFRYFDKEFMQTGAVRRCTWKVDVSRVMCRRSCLVFIYNKSLLFYSCFTKTYLVISLYYLICNKLCSVNRWKSSWLCQWNRRGGVGFIDWEPGLSAFRDGLGGRLVLCKGKYLSVFVVVCRYSGFCSATLFSYTG